MNTLGLFRLWLPSALSSALLSIELPIIAATLSYFRPESSADYAVALGIFMFANSFVFPLCTVVIKTNKSAQSFALAAIVTLLVFAIFNLALELFYAARSPAFLELMHFFSLSLLAVGARRYFQGVCILENNTRIIFGASAIRILFSTIGCYLFIVNGITEEWAAIYALVLGAYVEAFVLILSTRFSALSFFEPRRLSWSELFRPYYASFLIFAATLTANFLVVVCVHFSGRGDDALFWWPAIFSIITFSYAGLIDLENILIKAFHESISVRVCGLFILALIVVFPVSFLLLSRVLLLTLPLDEIFHSALSRHATLAGVCLVPVFIIFRAAFRAYFIHHSQSKSINVAVATSLFFTTLFYSSIDVAFANLDFLLVVFLSFIVVELIVYLISWQLLNSESRSSRLA
ncbi:hypothetical protein [Marinobacter bohaiensis]|uniref:hypothetical protein n=1 Tax=Marinobacter bohaiensis TaxID=2201898 RepID=UPI000DAE0AD9|nr:hypothetical protein [Marinobacter bohaiensis]